MTQFLQLMGYSAMLIYFLVGGMFFAWAYPRTDGYVASRFGMSWPVVLYCHQRLDFWCQNDFRIWLEQGATIEH